MVKSRKQPKYPILSLSRLAEASDVDYKMIYNNVAGVYSSLDANTKTKLANTALDELMPFFDFLGFDMKIIKRKPQPPK